MSTNSLNMRMIYFENLFQEKIKFFRYVYFIVNY